MKRWLLPVFRAGCILNAVAESHTGWQTGKVLSFDSREWTAPSSLGDGLQTGVSDRLATSRCSAGSKRDGHTECYRDLHTVCDEPVWPDDGDCVDKGTVTRALVRSSDSARRAQSEASIPLLTMFLRPDPTV
jgi:hypothetical protein